MEPTSVVAGALTRGLLSLLAKVGQVPPDHSSPHDLVAKAAEEMVESIDWAGPERIEEICLFLSLPEVTEIIGKLFVSRAIQDEDAPLRGAVEREFLTLFEVRVNRAPTMETERVRRLFRELVKTVNRVFANATREGSLMAHEARAAFRHHDVLDRLAAIDRNITLLKRATVTDIDEYVEFGRSYRTLVRELTSHITPPYYSEAHRIPIGEIYVAPYLQAPRSENALQEERAITADEFARLLSRTVLLGNPGAGKSTLARKIAHDMASTESMPLPFLVVLRDYATQRRERQCSIVQFLESSSTADFQIEPPPKGIDYLLLNGRAAVIFDGLDELTETRNRQQVRNDIELFCTRYPDVPVLVTSREVGYEQAPLNPRRFHVHLLLPFDEDQIRDYANKWFRLNRDSPNATIHTRVTRFLDESEIVPDLRSNPLMLALMCNVYRGDNYIPRNRPDLYEKCALMLFERWDKQRGIEIGLPFEAHILPTIKFLAYWIYENQSLQNGVRRSDLVRRAATYLYPRKYDDEEEARRAAEEFLDFCRGRAWVFTEIGTAEDDEPLFQFTHRTFLEYFAGGYLVRANPTPDLLADVLIERLGRQEWDMVAQLAVQIQDKNVEDASDSLLSQLMVATEAASASEARSLLSFAARCLGFVVPGPKVVREVTSLSMNGVLSVWSHDGGVHSNGANSEVIRALFSVADENRDQVRSALMSSLGAAFDSGEEERGALALDFCINGQLAAHFGGGPPGIVSDQVEQWARALREFAHSRPHLEVLARGDASLCAMCVFADLVSLEQLFEWHGSVGFFGSPGSRVYGVQYVSLAQMYLRRAMNDFAIEEAELGVIHDGLLRDGPPWLLPDAIGIYPLSSNEPSTSTGAEGELRGEKLLAAILVAACQVERWVEDHPQDFFLPLGLGRLTPARALLVGRSEGKLSPHALDRLASLDISSEWVAKLGEWAQGSRTLTEPVSR